MGSAKEFFSVPTGGGSFYPASIPYSCRFDSARTCYMQRTPAVTGNRKTWTFSAWVKRCNPEATKALFHAYNGSSTDDDQTYIVFYSDGTLQVYGYFTQYATTNALFRDTAQWYHVCVALDTTQATASNRLKVWVNGTLQTFSTFNAPAQNADLAVNYSASYCRIAQVADYYIADAYLIDGTALTASTFGQFSTQNPTVWVPITPTGLTYGTNGFHLDFANAAALGTDISGNGNTYTSNGLTTADQMTDTPTNDYCTLNPLSVFVDASSPSISTLSNGNLKSAGLAGTNAARAGTFSMSVGKWYFEVSYAAQDDIVGVTDSPGLQSLRYKGVGFYLNNGNKVIDGSFSAYGSTSSGTRTVGVAVDVDSSTVEFFDNNVSQGVISHTFDGPVVPAVWHAGNGTVLNLNFGATAFAYTPPTGFKALCTANMPSPLPAIAISGSFTGNASVDGPFVYTGGVPETLSIDGNAVTWVVHADKLANGFKLRCTTSGYNNTGTHNWTATCTNNMQFPHNNAQGNP